MAIMARAVPWEIQGSSEAPRLQDEQMEVLLFGILRELLNPSQLSQVYAIVQGRPMYKGHLPDHCLTSVRKGSPRTVSDTSVNRLENTTCSEGAELVSEQTLADFELPLWVLGTRLKFQTDRWYVAPPKVPGIIQTLQTKIRALGHPSDEDGPRLDELIKLQRELNLHKKPVFTAVSRLLCFDRHRHPAFSGIFPTHKVLAVHHACLDTRAKRARCVNVDHICWGEARDNIYHRVVHDSEANSSEDEYLQPPLPRRPRNWVSPSKRQDRTYVRLRDRLKEGGSRKLKFTGGPGQSVQALSHTQECKLLQTAYIQLHIAPLLVNQYQECNPATPAPSKETACTRT